jgi:hypothetical protein
VLGIGGTLELNEAGIKAAFNFRVRQLRPDLTDDQADALRVKDVAGETEAPADKLQFECGSKQEQLAELLWAREFLVSRLPKPVTATAPHQADSYSSRNGAVPEWRRPVVTASTLRSRSTVGSRNARVLGQVEAALKRYKHVAAGNPKSRVAERWRERSEDEHFTELAVSARLICGGCAGLLDSPVYLYRCSAYGRDLDSHFVDGDNLRAWCSTCWQATKEHKFYPDESERRQCACGTEIVCTGERWHSTRWWWADRAQSCSPLCARERRNADARDRRLAARENRRCVVCDTEFTPARSDGRYCSSACRQDAYRKRKIGATSA